MIRDPQSSRKLCSPQVFSSNGGSAGVHSREEHLKSAAHSDPHTAHSDPHTDTRVLDEFPFSPSLTWSHEDEAMLPQGSGADEIMHAEGMRLTRRSPPALAKLWVAGSFDVRLL